MRRIGPRNVQMAGMLGSASIQQLQQNKTLKTHILLGSQKRRMLLIFT